MLHMPQTCSCVPMLLPNQRVGKHKCTRQSSMYVTVAPDQQPCFYKLHTISIQHTIAVTASSYKHPFILHLNLAISHGCNNCIRQFVEYFTSALNQQLCLLNLHIQACMSDTLAPDQHSYLLKQYPTTCAVCCTHHSSIVEMVVTIAPDQQACILQLHPTSSQDGNEHLQHTDVTRGLFCVDTLHSICIFFHFR